MSCGILFKYSTILSIIKNEVLKMNVSEYENFRENKKHIGLFFPYNTYLCSIPLDFSSVPTHWHDEMELIVIKKGRGYVALDLEKRVVRAGQIVIVLPGQLHAISQFGEEVMEYENIIFRMEMLYAREEDICAMEFLEPYREGRILYQGWIDGTKAYHREMVEHVKRMDELCRKRPRGYQIGVKGWLCQFFFMLFSNEDPKKTEVGKERSRAKMKQILKKIESDYQKPLDIKDMATFAGFSESHFMKFFKNHMGTPFIQYLNDYRLTMAARRLLETDEDVLKVAMDVGITNVSYFNRLFKKKFQMTPLEYRGLKRDEWWSLTCGADGKNIDS